MENHPGAALVDRKQMSLSDAEAELKSMGFTTSFDANGMLVGVDSKFHWDLTAKIDTLVFVHEVNGVLDEARIYKDSAELPLLVNRYFTYGLPPFGFSRGINTLVIYYAESITPEAVTHITRVSNSHWCHITFLAAQNTTTSNSYMLSERSTPCLGKALHPMLRYQAGRLTGNTQVEAPSRVFFQVLQVIVLLFLVFLFFQNPNLMFVMLVIFGSMFLVAAALQCYSMKRQNTGPITNNSGVSIAY